MKALRLLHAALVFIVVAAFLPAAQTAAAHPPFAKAPAGGQFVPGEVVVSFRETLPGSMQTAAASVASEVHAQVAFQYGNMAVLSVDPGADVQALSAQIEATGRVAVAQPNYVYSFPDEANRTLPGGLPKPGYTVHDTRGRAQTLTSKQLSQLRTVVKKNNRTQSIPAFPKEFVNDRFNVWGWDEVEAEVIWRNAVASPAICLVDSGVDARHPDLAGRVLPGPDYVTPDNVPNDDNGHGTHIAGILVAAADNTAGSAVGISNGKIVAVKSMNAQGFGTTASVTAGILYCADRTGVRVINLSLGSSQKDTIQYNALRYAIQTRGILVVAAAGNEGSSDPIYPAAWTLAAETPPAGAQGGAGNEIYPGLISVAAGRSNPAYESVWIDTNHNGSLDAGEVFDGRDCATSFSNFGKYVDLVAPGDMIYSDQPVSYTFFNQYLYGYQSKYDYYSGTSQATAFVSGAAARVLSVFSTLPVYSLDPAVVTLKKRLVSTGRPLDYSMEMHQGGDPAFDPAHPYDPVKNAAYHYGEVVYPDPAQPSQPYIRMPFCWPKQDATPNNPYTSDQDMSAARYLDVSAGMGRVGFYTEATDAYTGLPLTGAQIVVAQEDGRIIDKAVIGSASSAAMLLNIPLPAQGNVSNFYFYVTKTGYTSGYQFFEGAQLQSPEDNLDAPKGGVLITVYSTVAVPPARDMAVVLNWDRLASANLDLHVWLPEDAHDGAKAIQGVVSAGKLHDYIPAYPPALDLGKGSLLPASLYAPGGVSPYMQLMHDGGYGSFAEDVLNFDAVAIKTKVVARVVQPFYTAPDITQPYYVYVTDYSGSYAGGKYTDPDYKWLNAAPSNPYFAYPIVRVWAKGKLIINDLSRNSVALAASTDPACSDATHDWWFALKFQGTTVTTVNTCGTAQAAPGHAFGILPYPVTP